jgi:cystathionine beta-synthase
MPNLIEAIGNTPLVTIPLGTKHHISAKLEYLNPGGSVKDRSARYMIEYAEKNGLLKPGGTIIDASSGNQGIATAMIGAMKGYRVIISVSEKISAEKLATIKAYGAEVIINPPTDFLEDPKSYHSVALRLHQQTPNSFMPNQYFNPINAEGHYTLLAPEVWEQTKGSITHFFSGAGTGGTVSGVGKYLKEKNPDIKVIAVDSANSWRATKGHPQPYIVEGIGIDFESPVMNYAVVDEVVTVTDAAAMAMLKQLARQGFLVGPSSGAIAYAAKQYLSTCSEPVGHAVMIFSDSGRAYLSKGFYAQDESVTMASPKEVALEQ